MFSGRKIIHNPPTGRAPDMPAATHWRGGDKLLKTRGFSGFPTYPPCLLQQQFSLNLKYQDL
jgi:hypothetical protein